MSWMRWFTALSKSGKGVDEPKTELLGMDQEALGRALGARGVPELFCAALAERVSARLEGATAEEMERLLDGVALALDFQQETQEQLTRNLRGLKEVERMMGAFSGELSKLDEVLGVLAAYVRRMKTSGHSSQNRVLH